MFVASCLCKKSVKLYTVFLVGQDKKNNELSSFGMSENAFCMSRFKFTLTHKSSIIILAK